MTNVCVLWAICENQNNRQQLFLLMKQRKTERNKERNKKAKTKKFFSQHFWFPRPPRQCVGQERGSTTDTCTVLPSEWQRAVGGKVWGIGAAEQSVSSPTDLGLTMCACVCTSGHKCSVEGSDLRRSHATWICRAHAQVLHMLVIHICTATMTYIQRHVKGFRGLCFAVHT